MATVEDNLEVGCLHVGLIAVRNIKAAKHGGVGDFFGLLPQHKPYCKITLGVRAWGRCLAVTERTAPISSTIWRQAISSVGAGLSTGIRYNILPSEG